MEFGWAMTALKESGADWSSADDAKDVGGSDDNDATRESGANESDADDSGADDSGTPVESGADECNTVDDGGAENSDTAGVSGADESDAENGGRTDNGDTAVENGVNECRSLKAAYLSPGSVAERGVGNKGGACTRGAGRAAG